MLSSPAGELKKLLSARTGLHPEDQKLVYKDKERDSKAFLDMAGVKDRSKMVLLEDPAAQAKRLLEQRRTDKAERAAKSISRISLDVDKLATKVRIDRATYLLVVLLAHGDLGRVLSSAVKRTTQFGAGVGAGDHRQQGRQGGGCRRGHPHRGAHERAGQAGLHRRRGRGQGAAANAGQYVRCRLNFLPLL